MDLRPLHFQGPILHISPSQCPKEQSSKQYSAPFNTADLCNTQSTCPSPFSALSGDLHPPIHCYICTSPGSFTLSILSVQPFKRARGKDFKLAMEMTTETATSPRPQMTSTRPSATMSEPDMAFNTNNLGVVLFSQSWMPTTTAGYVGTWFFLFFLSVIWRASAASLAKLDAFWAAKNVRYSILTNGGQDQPTQKDVGQSWRISINVPRAFLRMVHQGIAYLLMIAVMTMNIGFFLAVLVGYFFGELIFGRVSRAD